MSDKLTANVGPIRATLRLHNNRLKRCREELGLSARAASERIGVPYVTLLDFENMHTDPLKENGEIRDPAVKIAAFYGHPVDWLWPDVVRRIKRAVVVRELDDAPTALPRSAAPMLMSESDATEHEVDMRDMIATLRPLVRKLPGRESEVLIMRFGLDGDEPMTLEEIGERIGVGREQARRLCEDGLNMLRSMWPIGSMDERLMPRFVAKFWRAKAHVDEVRKP